MTTAITAMIDRYTLQVKYPPVTEELLEAIVQRILSTGSPLKIVLFGSRARGSFRPDSDLDILVIEGPGVDCRQLAGAYLSAVRGLFPELDLRVDSIHEVAAWRNVPNYYLSEAMRNGKVLFEDRAALAAYCKSPPNYQGDSTLLFVCEEVAPKTSCDYARRWFTLADGDLEDGKILFASKKRFRNVCLFSQQAIEKYLKGFLELNGIATEKTHNLNSLDSQCKQLAQLPDLPRPLLEAISKYAIDARYDADFVPAQEEAEEALAVAEQIRENVLALVPPEARPQEV